MIKMDGQLLLVGAGKMGSAMLSGWLEGGITPDQILIIEPSLSDDLSFLMAQQGIQAVLPADLKQPPQVVILAVKPQIMQQVVAPLAQYFDKNTLVISIAAGQTLSTLEGYVGMGKPVVRVMPNTPASIGRGMSVACANSGVTTSQKDLCSALMAAVGDVAWVEDEALMDAVTAVSGSGPAYIFLLAEVMAAAGEKAGLSAGLARQLADATVSGAGELLRQSGEEASVLRKNVTSPGGTTQAALDVLMNDKDGMALLMDRAVQAAVKRSKELS